MAELKNSRKEKETEADAEGGSESGLSAAQVRAYLLENPQFLAKHPELLESVDLQHKAGGAVSLIERQVEILRAKNQRLQDRLDRLMEAAQGNEKRAESVHKLARTLMRAPSLGGVAAGLRSCMRDEFNIDEIFIGLNSQAYKRHDIDGIVVLEPDGKIARAFENFFRTKLIECGPIKEAPAKLLFPNAKVSPRTAAIVPLEKDKTLGMIALGSRDDERFHPKQGKLFLEMVADLVAAAVRARL